MAYPKKRSIAPVPCLSTGYFYESELPEDIIIAGVDEAGRGPLAGPVVAAAVIFRDYTVLHGSGLNDSKKLTAKRREELFDYITDAADSFAIAEAGPTEIDEQNILQATYNAMHRSIEQLGIKPGHLLIDGNRFRDMGIPHTTLIGGDARAYSIAAASILAKVTRDHFMATTAHEQYPEYAFDRHKGYGTKLHYEALEQYGPCPLHRRSFLKKFFSRQLSLFD